MKKNRSLTISVDDMRQFSRYKAATISSSTSRRLDLNKQTADYNYALDRENLLMLSEWARQNNPVYAGMIGLAAANYLGQGGPNLKPETKSKKLNEQIENYFAEEMKSPEVRGLDSFAELQYRWAAGLLYHGDIGAIKIVDPASGLRGKIQVITSWRIASSWSYAAGNSGNRVKMGIEVDSLGRIAAFYIQPPSADESYYARYSGKRYPADTFLFSALRTFSDQTRGEMPLVSSFRYIDQLEDILSSVAASWQIVSRLAFAVKTQAGATWHDNKGETDDRAEDEDLAAKVSYLPGATVISGQPGDEFSTIKSEVPGLGFNDNVLLYLRLIGIPLGLPIEIVLNDWSKTNYTSGRGALMQAFRKFLSLQETHESSFLRPWYEWKIKLAIEDGILPDRPDIYQHFWNWPTFPWIDELKEAEAWSKKITGGLATHSEALGSLGKDRSEYLAKAEQEVREAIKISKQIQKDTGQEVDWRTFCGREAQGKTAQAAAAGKDETAGETATSSDGKSSKENQTGGKE